MVAAFKYPIARRDMELVVKGDYFGRSATISLAKSVIAKQERAKDWFMNPTYLVSVVSGVDLALVAAIFACFGEQQQLKR
jgi:hypothetical protein